MTLGHLVLAPGSTGYIVLATLAFEERDLARNLGGRGERELRPQPPAGTRRLAPRRRDSAQAFEMALRYRSS
jgi:hypothetical protein